MFSIRESFNQAWEKFKNNTEISLLTTLLLVAVMSIALNDHTFQRSYLFGMTAFVFMIIIFIGYTKIFLKISDGGIPKFIDIFQEYKIFWRYLGVCTLFGLSILGGIIIFFIPGVILGVRFSLSPIIVVDNKTSPLLAMKESFTITKGSFWRLLFFWILIGFFNLIGFMAFGLGLIVSIPVSILASIWIYRGLTKIKAGLSNPISSKTIIGA